MEWENEVHVLLIQLTITYISPELMLDEKKKKRYYLTLASLRDMLFVSTFCLTLPGLAIFRALIFHPLAFVS